MAYLTVANLKLYLGISDTTEDTLLAQLIDRSQSYIDTHTHRNFESAADTIRYFDAKADVHERGTLLMLDEDLLSVTTLTNGDGTTVDPSSYVLLPPNENPKYAIKLTVASGLYWTYEDDHINAISIEGRWGYSLTPPNDIVHAIVRLSSYLYRQKDNAGEFDRTVLAGNSTLLPTQIPRDIEQLLMPYTRYIL